MVTLLFFCLLVSLFSMLKFFNSKIMVLLCLEVCLVCLICMNLLYSFSSKSTISFFSSLVFLTFMVVDSVFGLSLLIFITRNSSVYNNFLFSI